MKIKNYTMKRLTLFMVFATMMSGLFAQNCAEYYPLSTGSNWDITQYNKKDKPESINHVTVSSYSDTDNGYLAVLTSSTIDDKGNNAGTSEVWMKCENGVFYFDMKNFIPSSTLETYKEMEIDVVATDLQYPETLENGSNLNDANITFQAKSNGFPVITININITNRKVVGKESVVTPAGTFEAWKISYNVDSKMGIIKAHSSIIEYLSPGNGIVKSETYNEKGVLQGYSLLTKIEKK